VAAWAVPAAPSSTALLPSTSLVFDSNRTGNYEIFSMGEDGSAQHELTRASAYDSWWPRVSPDRSQILFYRTPAGVHDRDFTKTSLWVMNADGSNLHRILAPKPYGWGEEGHAVWSPDGTKIVLFAGPTSKPQIWEVNTDGSSPVQVTARKSLSIDPSFDPSGRILFISCPSSLCSSAGYEVYRMNGDGSGQTRLTTDMARDQDPFSSPDGTRIAWLRSPTLMGTWAIYIMRSDGSNPHGVVSNLAVNSKPAWSADGSWIFFHRESIGQTSFGVWKVHPDGTGLQEIAGGPSIGPSPYANEYPDQSEY
jgi:Tol biopolymer transport system component